MFASRLRLVRWLLPPLPVLAQTYPGPRNQGGGGVGGIPRGFTAGIDVPESVTDGQGSVSAP